MEIKQAQKLIKDYLEEIGYTKIETTPVHAFLHLVEEVGETARSLLHKDTKRDALHISTEPKELEEEVADIFWQTLKLAVYLDIDLESCFLEKHEKNKAKPR